MECDYSSLRSLSFSLDVMSSDSALIADLQARLAAEQAQREAAETAAASEKRQREAAEAAASSEKRQREAAEAAASSAKSQREAAEAAAASEKRQREVAEAERDEALARAAAVSEQASLDASLALLTQFALLIRSSQWRTQVLPKLTPRPFPATLLPELPPHVRDRLAITMGSICPLPDNASETDESREGTVHWLVRKLMDAVQSVLPARWTVLHEPQCLKGSGDTTRSDIPDWALFDPRDASLWSTVGVLVEAKTVERADKSTAALLEEGCVSVTRYAAQALQARTNADSTGSAEVLCLVTNGRTLQALYYTMDPRAETNHINLYMSEPLALFEAGVGLAPGVELLARVFHASPQHLSGCAALPKHVSLPADGDSLPLELELGRRLGVGGSCDVFESAGSDPPAVVKLLRSQVLPARAAQALEQLRREAEALRAMQPCIHLPQLLRCSFGDTPCLLLSPAGVPLMQLLCCCQSDTLKMAAAETAVRHVLLALRCAHEHGFLHNDLRTCNVVGVTAAAGSGSAATRFLLVDWGLSQRMDASLNVGVVGYAPCACDAALAATGRNAVWLATRATDVECVAYLCATALEGLPSGRPPWVQAALRCAIDQKDEQRLEHVFLCARNDWMNQQTAQSLPKRILRHAVELARSPDAPDMARYYMLD